MHVVVSREVLATWSLLEAERCSRAARWLKCLCGALWVCDEVYGDFHIPLLWEHEELVRYTAM